MQNTYQLYQIAACRILRYLKGAPGKRLYYRHSSHLNVVGYSDVDLGGNPIDRHSTTYYYIFVGDNLVT